MSKSEKISISLDECRRRVRIDLEREMGIYDALKNHPTPEVLEIVVGARAALEPVIELHAELLYKWHHR